MPDNFNDKPNKMPDNTTDGNEPAESPQPVAQQPAKTEFSKDQPTGSIPVAAPVASSSQPSTTFSQPQPAAMGVGPQPKNNKKLIFGIVAAVLGVALIGGGVGAYMWYQSPEKVLNDSLVNMVTAKSGEVSGTANLTTEVADAKLTYKSKSDNEKGSGTAELAITPKNKEFAGIGEVKVTGDTILDKDGTVYIKVGGVKNAFEKAVSAYVDSMYGKSSSVSGVDSAQFKAQVVKMYTPVIEEVDGKWIKVSAADIKEAGSDSRCVQDTIKKLNTDKAMRDELFTAYGKNKFITVKKELGVKDGNIGYQLDLNKTKAEEFGKDLKNTKLVQELKKCDGFKENNSSSSSESLNSSDITVEVWIGQWSHTINQAKVVVTDKDKATNKFDVTMNFMYNTKVDVTAPSGAKSIKEVGESIQKVMPSDMQGPSSPPISPYIQS